ncbi:retrovirus-related pol polyprotein from transposon TNT 1-94 [Tanacetum coccineum]
MFEDLQYVQSLENEVDELESEKAEFSNEYDLLLQECLSKDIMCSTLLSFDDINEQTKMQFMYLEKYEELRFGNDQFALILGYRDLVQGNVMIKRVYYIEGLNHNPFSVGQLCDADLELRYVKDQLCSFCELGKAKRSTFKTKTVPSSKGRLHLLHMDLCGPMRVESINGNKYVLVIVDDYSRYTWTHFLRSKDETPEVLIDFLKMIQRGLQAQVITVRTDKGT